MKSWSKLFIGAALVTSILVGCGNSSDKSEGSKSDGKYSDVKLVYWSNWDSAEPQGKVISEAVKEFESETGATVDLQFKGRSGIKQGLIPALDAKQQIDMFDGPANKVNYGKRIISLEDLVKKTDYEKDTNPMMMKLIRGYHDGTLSEIPYQLKLNGFLYNKTLFKKAGIDVAPKTEAEFVEDCQKLKDAGITPMTTDDAYAPQAFSRRLERLVGDNTAEIAMNSDWNQDAVKSTADFFADLASKGYFSKFSASNVWPTGQNTEFAAGKVAMYCAGTFLPNEVKKIVSDDFEWGFFTYPEVENGINGTDAIVIGCQSFAITTLCKKTDAAMDLIAKITRGKWDQKLSDESIGIPTDINNTDWPKELKDVKPYADNMKEILGQALGLESNPDVTPSLKENLMKLYVGKLTPDKFITNMEKVK